MVDDGLINDGLINDGVVHAVRARMAETHARTIGPHFRDLTAGQVEIKAAGEVVTVADRACERYLGPLLQEVVAAPVLGEEAAAAEPSLLDLIDQPGPLWLIDPIDGTRNFADGSPDYAVMVALLCDGHTEASWILQPQHDRVAIAVRGAGATIDGVPVTLPQPDGDPARWTGIVKDRFVPEELRATVAGGIEELGARRAGPSCAGLEYPDLVTGDATFLFYWRTRPWDHAPGALLVQEAGGRVIRPDGQDYRVDQPGQGLIVGAPAVVDRVVTAIAG